MVEYSASHSRVVRTGVPNSNVGRGSIRGASVPFLFIIFGALALGGSTASRYGCCFHSGTGKCLYGHDLDVDRLKSV